MTMLQRPDSRHAEGLERLRAYIRENGYGRGDRLPPERRLIEDLEMSRAALRQALEALEHSGAIWRHVGKGTFVGGAPLEPGAPGDAIVSLGRDLTPMRMMQARLCIEPALAREAAIHATAANMAAMEQAEERARAAASWSEYEAQDDVFHRTVAGASDNALLLEFFDQLNRVRRAVTWGSVARRSARPPSDHSSFDEHRGIVARIAARDADGACAAMRAHLKSVSVRLFP